MCFAEHINTLYLKVSTQLGEKYRSLHHLDDGNRIYEISRSRVSIILELPVAVFTTQCRLALNVRKSSIKVTILWLDD